MSVTLCYLAIHTPDQNLNAKYCNIYILCSAGSEECFKWSLNMQNRWNGSKRKLKNSRQFIENNNLTEIVC